MKESKTPPPNDFDDEGQVIHKNPPPKLDGFPTKPSKKDQKPPDTFTPEEVELTELDPDPNTAQKDWGLREEEEKSNTNEYIATNKLKK